MFSEGLHMFSTLNVYYLAFYYIILIESSGWGTCFCQLILLGSNFLFRIRLVPMTLFYNLNYRRVICVQKICTKNSSKCFMDFHYNMIRSILDWLWYVGCWSVYPKMTQANETLDVWLPRTCTGRPSVNSGYFFNLADQNKICAGNRNIWQYGRAMLLIIDV